MNGNEGCTQCEFWNESDRAHETFRYLWGSYEYDIDKAYTFVTPDRIYDQPVATAAVVVDYPVIREEGKIHMSMDKVPVNEKHLDHVNMEIPILIAFSPIPQADGRKRRLIIDGHHRIARAVRDGLVTLKAFLLTEEETDQVLTDYSPKKRKSPKRKIKTS